MKVIVTGGAGFVGSHLCDRLIEQGHEVLCIDDFSTGSRENIAHLADHPHFDVFDHDVTFPYFAPADRIYNLACPASPIHYQRDPIKTILTNVQGTIHGLELAHRTGARFLQASTRAKSSLQSALRRASGAASGTWSAARLRQRKSSASARRQSVTRSSRVSSRRAPRITSSMQSAMR